VAGARNGYFDLTEAPNVADDVAATNPDVIFVAITSPKKEQFLKLLGERTSIPVAHGVGGSFDVYAGKTKRAPVWMQRSGLEWFFRILQEPRRMWRRYAVTNTLFLLLLGKNILRPQPEFPCEGRTL
jgi:N-acetylglucosaminyldiphosphoundecaprenol N-acetyl-beta-D-mannosaminyltransferase